MAGDGEEWFDDRSLSQRINDVLTDFLADEGGGFPTAFYLVAEFIDSDGDEQWIDGGAEDQSLPRTMGLVEWARGSLKKQQKNYLDALDGEE